MGENVARVSKCSWFLVIFAVLVITACTLTPTSEPEATPASSVQSPSLPPAEPASPPPSQRRNVESRLLLQAQQAFRDARYTTPSHDNAYDKFQSVLMINPESTQARAGVQAILLNYAQLIRSALNEGRIQAARSYLTAAEIYYPANPLLMDLKSKIREEERAMARSSLEPAAESAGEQYEDIPLTAQELNRRSEQMKQKLIAIAQRLQETEESVLIFARNDREGRWIYRQLKEATPGYRVRGDIRVSSTPKLRILPPL